LLLKLSRRPHVAMKFDIVARLLEFWRVDYMVSNLFSFIAFVLSTPE
jgi:hypothetical protein